MGLTRTLARRAFHACGGLQLVRRWNRDRVRILMHHRFPTNATGCSWLHEQCAHIRKYYQPVTLSQIAAWARCERPLPESALAVTIDDGYEDCVHACQVFRSYDITPTVFLTTDFIDRRLWLWFDQVAYAIQHARVPTVEITLGGETKRFQLGSPAQRGEAAQTVSEWAIQVPNLERQRFMAGLGSLAGIELPQEAPAGAVPVSWERVRAMAADGVEIGAHTKSHPILSRVEDAAELQNEVEFSKRRIEEELDRPVLHFCYTNGKPQDINAEVVRSVRAAGYRTAVTAISGLNGAGSDPLLLKRIAADEKTPPYYFRQCTAGFRV